MKWPSGGAVAVGGAAFFLAVVIIVLPFLVPAGTASKVLGTPCILLLVGSLGFTSFMS